MNALSRIGVALSIAVCIAGCVTPGASTVPSAVVTPVHRKLISADRIENAIAIGKSTRADVIAALGETLVISFDSGFEVWVYQLESDTPGKAARGQDIARTRSTRSGATGEYVILFAPSGLVAKTRIRPAPL